MPRPGIEPTGMVSTTKMIFSRQPNHQVAVGMVGAEIVQLERGVAELDGLFVTDRAVGQRRVRIVELGEPLARILVRDDGGAGVLERLAAGDVIEVVVAVDQVADRRLRDLADFGDVIRPAGGPAIADRVGGDHAVLGDDEYRLMVAVAEDVDAVRAVDLGGLDLRPLGFLLGLFRCLFLRLQLGWCVDCGKAERDERGSHCDETNARHFYLPLRRAEAPAAQDKRQTLHTNTGPKREVRERDYYFLTLAFFTTAFFAFGG